jgi:hypothetical protein
MKASPIQGATGYTVTESGGVFRDGVPVPKVVSKYGTRKVSVRMDRGYRTVHVVSRLVGRAFCPEFREDLRPVHINGDRSDCRASNLRWVSISSITPGGGKRKLSDADIHEIRTCGESSLATAARFGISRVHVWTLRRKHLTKSRSSCPLLVQ